MVRLWPYFPKSHGKTRADDRRMLAGRDAKPCLHPDLSAMAPGTGRAAHSHKDFPETARILSGTLTQGRVGEAQRT